MTIRLRANGMADEAIPIRLMVVTSRPLLCYGLHP
jgi:hypothetical protein